MLRSLTSKKVGLIFFGDRNSSEQIEIKFVHVLEHESEVFLCLQRILRLCVKSEVLSV